MQRNISQVVEEFYKSSPSWPMPRPADLTDDIDNFTSDGDWVRSEVEAAMDRFWDDQESAVNIDGHAIQIDPSGQGHAWQPADELDCPANIRAELAAEIIDGRRNSGKHIASNGALYRW